MPRKLLKGGNYSRKYGIKFQICQLLINETFNFEDGDCCKSDLMAKKWLIFFLLTNFRISRNVPVVCYTQLIDIAPCSKVKMKGRK